jgi:carboxymethylenebutenolidase
MAQQVEQQIEQKRLKADDFHPEVLRLFDRYVHGMIDRRGFLDGAAKFAVGGMTAAAMLQALSPNYAYAEQVPKDDKRITTMMLDYDSPKGQGKMKGYFAKPANMTGKLPAVLVVHENRGLTPYVQDVVRRLAVANFVAFGPDALTPLGGYPGTDDKGVEMQRTLDQNKIIEDFIEAVSVLQKRPESTGKVGGRLLLRGQRLQPAGGPRADTLGLGAVLRRPAQGRRRPEDQGGADDPLRRS